jgi:hypothetical protein
LASEVISFSENILQEHLRAILGERWDIKHHYRTHLYFLAGIKTNTAQWASLLAAVSTSIMRLAATLY